MSSNDIINIHDNIKTRTVPDYSDEQILIRFKDENEYIEWYKNVACNHASWSVKPHIKKTYPSNQQFIDQPLLEPRRINALYFYCDHFGKEKNKKIVHKKRKTNKPSKRTNCTARIIKYSMTDHTIEVNYKWRHVGHNPCDVEEFVRSPLPPDVKEWIKKHVEQDMDWKQIKKLLHESSPLAAGENKSESGILPKSSLIKYKDVKNLIDARAAKATRQTSNGKESVPNI